MSESSTRSGDWLTVSQSAAAIGVSERQARRYAGRLAGHDRQEAGHGAGHVATLVRLSAMQDLRTKTTPRGIKPDTAPDVRPDNTPDILAIEAGHEAGHIHATPDSDNARLLAERECELLRDALQRERQNADQWRAQVEAANRDAAELRAALRTALAAMPKALPSPEKLEQVGTDTSTRAEVAISSQDAQEATQTGATAKDTTSTQNVAQRGIAREMRPLWKVILGVR